MNLRNIVGILFLAVSFSSHAIGAAAESPLGNWTSVDDKTGVKRAEITISEANGVLSGTVTKIYPQPGDTGICEECPGAFKGKKVLGMQIMWGLKKEDKNEWNGGSILDPKTGKIYKVKATLDGSKLHVRGYIGISMLGRTQTWVR